jgi:hypothetical protein
MCAGLNTKNARLSTRRIIDCDLIAQLTCHVLEVKSSQSRRRSAVQTERRQAAHVRFTHPFYIRNLLTSVIFSAFVSILRA